MEREAASTAKANLLLASPALLEALEFVLKDSLQSEGTVLSKNAHDIIVGAILKAKNPRGQGMQFMDILEQFFEKKKK